MSSETELLDAFKAAALSVTKLYKTSAAAQTKSRTDGYQDCLEDLIAFLDREGLGTGVGEGSRIRRWALERVDGRDASQTLESEEDEVEKPESAASPEVHRAASAPQPSRAEVLMKDTEPPTHTVREPSPIPDEPAEIVVPSQETFTFQSSLPYPNLANLDLSDSHAHNSSSRQNTSSATPRTARVRAVRPGPRTALGRGAGQKRKVNLAEIFDLASLNNGKDVFGNGGKRGRFV
ncbi:hypothetical protein OQA88_9779 [Cercophora sp. LCS_1]